MLKKVLALLTPTERKRGAAVMAMMLVMALLDMLGVAAILPFMAVLANPSMLNTHAGRDNYLDMRRHSAGSAWPGAGCRRTPPCTCAANGTNA